MRQTSIILATALVTAAITICGMKAIGSGTTTTTSNVGSPATVNVMKMMREAKDLPVEDYDAY
jgi:hypothetical protein